MQDPDCQKPVFLINRNLVFLIKLSHLCKLVNCFEAYRERFHKRSFITRRAQSCFLCLAANSRLSTKVLTQLLAS